MIIVTGATGTLGRAVVDRLLERVPARQVGVSVRDERKATDLAARGVRVRQADFADPATLAAAFEGATRVLVVSASTTGEEAVRWHRTAIEAAVAAGAGRVVYTSHMGASPTSAFAPMRDHAATEALLGECGAAWTALRHGFYAASAGLFLGAARETGELRAPQDGPVAWTAHTDLAEAAALTLTTDPTTDPSGVLDGATPALTAAQTLDLGDVAALAAQRWGRPVRRVVVGDEDYRAGLVAAGTPQPLADLLVGMFVAARAGDFAPADPTLAALLGRAPRALSEVLASGLAPAR